MNIDKYCLLCNKKFNVTTNDLQKYCSVDCVRKVRKCKFYSCKNCGQKTKNKVYCHRKCRTSILIIKECKYCHQNFQQKHSRQQYCNLTCANRYNRLNYTKTIKRSKDEILLCNLLRGQYPQLNIINNDRDTFEGLEIDIWIPELKLAIEWNGPFHYKPIKGVEALIKQQNRDSKKLELANNLDIHLMVIMATTNKKQFNTAYDNICELINNLLKMADEQTSSQLADPC